MGRAISDEPVTAGVRRYFVVSCSDGMCTFICSSLGSFTVIKACSTGRLTHPVIAGLSSWKSWRLRRCAVSTWLHVVTDCDGYRALHRSPAHIQWTTRVFTLRTLMFIHRAITLKVSVGDSLLPCGCVWPMRARKQPRHHYQASGSSFLVSWPTLKSLHLQLSSLTCVRPCFPSKGEHLLVRSLPGTVVIPVSYC